MIRILLFRVIYILGSPIFGNSQIAVNPIGGVGSKVLVLTALVLQASGLQSPRPPLYLPTLYLPPIDPNPKPAARNPSIPNSQEPLGGPTDGVLPHHVCGRTVQLESPITFQMVNTSEPWSPTP